MLKATRRRWLVIGTGLLFLLGLAGGAATVARATSDDQVAWRAEVGISFTPSQVAQRNWESNAQALLTALASRVNARGASFTSKRSPRSDGGIDYLFTLSGKANIETFKQVVYGDLEPLSGGLLGGPASLLLKGAVTKGETVNLSLDSNDSTGSHWEIKTLDQQLLQSVGEPEVASKAQLLGAPMKETLHLVSLGDGETSVEMSYTRPWDKSAVATRKVILEAARLSLLTDLVNHAPLQSTPVGTDHLNPSTPSLTGATLPSSFDWRTSGVFPPIRDQGNCGSCWAFSTIGAFEPALMIKKAATNPDLSEQFLISCNTDGWGCNGGWFAHDYDGAKVGKFQTIAGSVQETAFPYAAADSTCTPNLAHSYKLDSWYYIGNSSSVAAVDAIKSAIYTYGPVSSAICVSNAFQAYRSGVFNTNEAGSCGTSKVNHAVVLIGWNDSDNSWIARNSWGTGWGESGYFRINRGVSNVGYAANYLLYLATPPPTLQWRVGFPLIISNR